jgi:hypothetical protein
MGRSVSQLSFSAVTAENVCLVTVRGVLDGTTYLQLRDAIIKAALDEPRAVLIDINALEVPAPTAWSVFTGAYWHLDTWLDVPIMVVCHDPERRRAVTRNIGSRYVPVHATMTEALACLTDGRRARRRAHVKLPSSLASLRRSRQFVAEWLKNWSHDELIPVATVVVNVFVENVLQHTSCAPLLIVESDNDAVIISVEDDCPTPAARHEDPYRGADAVSGLAIVASLSRHWGSAPTPSGKRVWAVVGPENRL